MENTITPNDSQNQILATFLTGTQQTGYYPQLVKKLKEMGICCPVVASALLQKLNYWNTKESGHLTSDRRRWIYNTYEEWGKQLGVSAQVIGKVVRSLVRHNILFKECFAHLRHRLVQKLGEIWHTYRTTSWLSINVEEVNKLLGNKVDIYHLVRILPKSSFLLPCPLKPASRAEVTNRTMHNYKQNNAKLQTELPSIYKKNTEITQKIQTPYSPLEVPFVKMKKAVDCRNKAETMEERRKRADELLKQLEELPLGDTEALKKLNNERMQPKPKTEALQVNTVTDEEPEETISPPPAIEVEIVDENKLVDLDRSSETSENNSQLTKVVEAKRVDIAPCTTTLRSPDSFFKSLANTKNPRTGKNYFDWEGMIEVRGRQRVGICQEFVAYTIRRNRDIPYFQKMHGGELWRATERWIKKRERFDEVQQLWWDFVDGVEITETTLEEVEKAQKMQSFWEF